MYGYVGQEAGFLMNRRGFLKSLLTVTVATAIPDKMFKWFAAAPEATVTPLEAVVYYNRIAIDNLKRHLSMYTVMEKNGIMTKMEGRTYVDHMTFHDYTVSGG